MKLTQICPKCQSREFWVVDEVRHPRCDDPRVSVPMIVATVELSFQRFQAGSFEAWVCGQCGFTEWYAKNFDEFVRIARVRDGGVRRVDARPQQGPYR